MDNRIEELRTLRNWLTTSHDKETAEEISSLLSSLGYPTQARKVMDIAKGEILTEEPDSYRMKELQRIVDRVIRKIDEQQSAAAPDAAVSSDPGPRSAPEIRRFRLEWIGYILMFLLGFIAGRYFG